MTDDAEQVSDGDSPYQILQEHLDKILEAGREDARRLADISKTLVSAIVAFLAVGLFRFGLSDSGSEIQSFELRTAVAALLITALGCLLWSSTYLIFRWQGQWRLSRIKKAEKKFSVAPPSSLLMLSDVYEYLPETRVGTAEYIRFRAAHATFKTSDFLVNQNALRETEIRIARIWFGRGVFAISLAVICYVGGWWYSPNEARPLPSKLESPAGTEEVLKHDSTRKRESSGSSGKSRERP